MHDTTILIVEDDPNTASFLYNQLVKLGYRRIDFAVNADEAIRIAGNSKPDLIFMDIFLRGSVSGIDTAHEILKKDAIPFIFVTASSNYYLIDGAGFKEYPRLLAKPFTLDDIRNSMKYFSTEQLVHTAEYREAERLKALHRYAIVDTPRERSFDIIANTAALVLSVPIALVTLVDRDKIWFKSRYGFAKNHIPKKPGLFAHDFLPKTFHQSNSKSQQCERNPLFSETRDIKFYACAPLLTDDGHPLGSLCVMDTRTRKVTREEQQVLTNLASLVMAEMEMRKAAADAYKRQREFVSTAVHNLKNPLTSVLGFSGILEKRLEGEQRDFTRHIGESARNMLGIVNNLLDTSLLELKQIRLARTPVRFAELLETVVDGNKAQAFAKKQTLNVKLDGDPLVNVDTIRIGEALDNFIGNAVKYSPSGTPIDISAGQRDEKVYFKVTDRGPGVEREKLKHIFEKFSEQDAVPTGGESSTGLGLAITKHLIELHGGTVSASSEGVGKGSTFYLEIPAISENEIQDYDSLEQLKLETRQSEEKETVKSETSASSKTHLNNQGRTTSREAH